MDFTNNHNNNHYYNDYNKKINNDEIKVDNQKNKITPQEYIANIELKTKEANERSLLFLIKYMNI